MFNKLFKQSDIERPSSAIKYSGVERRKTERRDGAERRCNNLLQYLYDKRSNRRCGKERRSLA